MKMVPKVKKKAPAPPKANTKAKAKALKGKKVVPKVVQSHKKKDLRVTYLLMTQDTVSLKAAEVSWKEHPQEKQA